MEISRRKILSGAGMVVSVLAAAPTEACSIVASQKRIDFSDSQCRRTLRELVDLINIAPSLSAAEMADRADKFYIAFDQRTIDRILPEGVNGPLGEGTMIFGWSMANGKRDKSPAKLYEVNLLKSEQGRALYQFTLLRDSYHLGYSEEQADQDGCGAPPYPPFFGPEKTSYLAKFQNNELREISAFDMWLEIA